MTSKSLDPEHLPDSEWIRLRQWSEGYDAGFNGERQVKPADFFDCGEYVAGFAQGMRDRKAAEAELPPHG